MTETVYVIEPATLTDCVRCALAFVVGFGAGLLISASALRRAHGRGWR